MFKNKHIYIFLYIGVINKKNVLSLNCLSPSALINYNTMRTTRTMFIRV